jgi:two-component system response regulator AtoC
MESIAPNNADYIPAFWNREGASTILVVDDDPGVLDELRSLLIDEGLTVRTARDAAQALDRLRRSPVALVVTDVVMPTVDGRTLAEEMRIRGDQTPVLLMSGAASTLRVAPGTRVLSKPLDFDELLAAVREALNASRLTRR